MRLRLAISREVNNVLHDDLVMDNFFERLIRAAAKMLGIDAVKEAPFCDADYEDVVMCEQAVGLLVTLHDPPSPDVDLGQLAEMLRDMIVREIEELEEGSQIDVAARVVVTPTIAAKSRTTNPDPAE